MKKTNKSAVLLLVLLVLVAISAMFVASTYAKYTAQVSNNGTVTVAKWKFSEDNQTTTVAVNFLDTVDTTSLVDGKVAPGTRGSFKINIKNTNSEVGAKVTMKVGTVDGLPTNMKLYSDEACTKEITDAGVVGTIAMGGNLDFPVYWKWAYETGDKTDGIAEGDSADTTAGVAAATLTIPLTLTGVQTNPSEAVSTGLQ